MIAAPVMSAVYSLNVVCVCVVYIDVCVCGIIYRCVCVV